MLPISEVCLDTSKEKSVTEVSTTGGSLEEKKKDQAF